MKKIEPTKKLINKLLALIEDRLENFRLKHNMSSCYDILYSNMYIGRDYSKGKHGVLTQIVFDFEYKDNNHIYFLGNAKYIVKKNIIKITICYDDDKTKEITIKNKEIDNAN